MKNLIVILAVLIYGAASSQQAEPKRATVRIKTVEDRNGVITSKDTTFSTDDITALKVVDGVTASAAADEDGRVQNVVVIGREGDDKISLDTDSDQDGTVIIDHDGPANSRKIIIVNRKSDGSSDTTVFRAGGGKCLQGNANEKKEYRQTVHVTSSQKGDASSPRSCTVVVVRELRISDPTRDDLKKLGQPVSETPGFSVEQLNIFPNPATGKFVLTLDIPTAGNTSIDIVNAAGVAVYKENLPGFSGAYSHEIDLQAQPKGSYFILVRQGDRSCVKKLMLN